MFEKFLAGQNERNGIAINVFFPFATTDVDRHDSMTVAVLSSTCVSDVIGVILNRYTHARRTPEVKASTEAYELRMVEDDCEPDMDLPALDRQEPMGKFHFESYCLVKSRRYDECTGDTEQGPAGAKHGSPALVRVHYSNRGCTILKRVSDQMTVGDVLDQTISKRALSTSSEYVLEIKGKQGYELDVSTTLKALDNIRISSPLEFMLFRTHSKRRDLEEESDAVQLSVFAESLAQHQANTYFVSKHNKFT